MQETAALRYSHALFETGRDQNKLDAFLEQMRDIAATFKAHEELKEFFNHPNVKEEEKHKVLNEVFKGVDVELIKLIELLNGHRRIGEIGIVYEGLRKLVYDFKGIQIATAVTAVPMAADEIEELRTKLSQKHKTQFEIENLVQPEVLGGVYLRIGDEVIDGSVRGQLERMRKELFNT